ncbi:PIR Superfamily Protein [Plasmodium ovale wallikeri]|uniref:PIR Superfamily Protein n=1 Tax=Plasmodium ovale wallikeri TaxID=864142 RepID=A0A1A9AKR3_PLAOA|nr:PIR Superfamily Protein [Plasmodium ovale wallikeri]SBT57215.1 PIR Superfamily Protein [Plasmodium ovale wallikeri]
MTMHPILNTLSPYKYYQQFDDENSLDEYNVHCSTIKSLYPGRDDILNFCKKLIRNLQRINTAENDEEKQGERCELLNYWLYSEVISTNYKCNYEKHYMSSHLFQGSKKTFDDLKIYDNIKSTINSDKNEKHEEFFNYITEKQNLYNTTEKECSCENQTKFCIEFHQYNIDNSKKAFCSLECQNNMSFPHLQNEQKTVCALSTKITRETEEEIEPEPVSLSYSAPSDENTTNSTSAVIVLTVFLSSILIFTPFKYWLLSRTDKIKSKLKSLTGERKLLSLHKSETEIINSNTIPYHIQYQYTPNY